jgi:hypothetical protein
LARFPAILDQPDTRAPNLDSQTLSTELRVISNIDMRGHHLVGLPGGDYTPVWTAQTTNPAIGNGTISGRWVRNGNLVTYWGKVVMGSTTTYGTGTWFISVPVPPAHSDNVGAAVYSDVGTDIITGATRVDNTGSGRIYFNPDSWGNVDASTPFTWVATDELRWQITYEVAS